MEIDIRVDPPPITDFHPDCSLDVSLESESQSLPADLAFKGVSDSTEIDASTHPKVLLSPHDDPSYSNIECNSKTLRESIESFDIDQSLSEEIATDHGQGGLSQEKCTAEAGMGMEPPPAKRMRHNEPLGMAESNALVISNNSIATNKKGKPSGGNSGGKATGRKGKGTDGDRSRRHPIGSKRRGNDAGVKDPSCTVQPDDIKDMPQSEYTHPIFYESVPMETLPFPIGSTDSTQLDASNQINELVQQQQQHQKRPWESWKFQETALFFEGVKVYGKDFDQIQTKIGCKTSDQIRYYFYRLVKKVKALISKADCNVQVTTPEDDMMLLLCFWTLHRQLLRKKSEKQIFTVNYQPNFCKRLQELFTNGTTIFKRKNKDVIIKAPAPPTILRDKKSLAEPTNKLCSRHNAPTKPPTHENCNGVQLSNTICRSHCIHMVCGKGNIKGGCNSVILPSTKPKGGGKGGLQGGPIRKKVKLQMSPEYCAESIAVEGSISSISSGGTGVRKLGAGLPRSLAKQFSLEQLAVLQSIPIDLLDRFVQCKRKFQAKQEQPPIPKGNIEDTLAPTISNTHAKILPAPVGPVTPIISVTADNSRLAEGSMGVNGNESTRRDDDEIGVDPTKKMETDMNLDNRPISDEPCLEISKDGVSKEQVCATLTNRITSTKPIQRVENVMSPNVKDYENPVVGEVTNDKLPMSGKEGIVGTNERQDMKEIRANPSNFMLSKYITSIDMGLDTSIYGHPPPPHVMHITSCSKSVDEASFPLAPYKISQNKMYSVAGHPMSLETANENSKNPQTKVGYRKTGQSDCVHVTISHEPDNQDMTTNPVQQSQPHNKSGKVTIDVGEGKALEPTNDPLALDNSSPRSIHVPSLPTHSPQHTTTHTDIKQLNMQKKKLHKTTHNKGIESVERVSPVPQPHQLTNQNQLTIQGPIKLKRLNQPGSTGLVKQKGSKSLRYNPSQDIAYQSHPGVQPQQPMTSYTSTESIVTDSLHRRWLQPQPPPPMHQNQLPLGQLPDQQGAFVLSETVGNNAGTNPISGTIPSKDMASSLADSGSSGLEKLSLYLAPHSKNDENAIKACKRNPRLRLMISRTKSIGRIVAHLQEKWKDVAEHISMAPSTTITLRIYPPKSSNFTTIDMVSSIAGWAAVEGVSPTADEIYRQLGSPEPFALEYGWPEITNCGLSSFNVTNSLAGMTSFAPPGSGGLQLNPLAMTAFNQLPSQRPYIPGGGFISQHPSGQISSGQSGRPTTIQPMESSSQPPNSVIKTPPNHCRPHSRGLVGQVGFGNIELQPVKSEKLTGGLDKPIAVPGNGVSTNEMMQLTQNNQAFWGSTRLQTVSPLPPLQNDAMSPPAQKIHPRFNQYFVPFPTLIDVPTTSPTGGVYAPSSNFSDLQLNRSTTPSRQSGRDPPDISKDSWPTLSLPTSSTHDNQTEVSMVTGPANYSGYHKTDFDIVGTQPDDLKDKEVQEIEKDRDNDLVFDLDLEGFDFTLQDIDMDDSPISLANSLSHNTEIEGASEKLSTTEADMNDKWPGQELQSSPRDLDTPRNWFDVNCPNSNDAFGDKFILDASKPVSLDEDNQLFSEGSIEP